MELDEELYYTLWLSMSDVALTGSASIASSFDLFEINNDEAVMTNGVYSMTLAGIQSDIVYIQLAIDGDPHTNFGITGTWKLAIVPQGCANPMEPTPTETPTPTATPTATTMPTPTATPPSAGLSACDGVTCPEGESCDLGVCHAPGSRILAVPDGCDGYEVLPSQWDLLYPGQSRTWNPNHGYNEYTVRWTFRADPSVYNTADVSVSGFLLGLSWSGPSSGESLYYEVTMPAHFYDNPAQLYAKNTHAESTVMIASICIQPIRTIQGCINDDPEFSNPSKWQIGPPAYINNDALHLTPGGWAQQTQYLSAGARYRVQLQAQALPSGSSQVFDLYVGSALYRRLVIPIGDIPTHFYFDFTATDATPILTLSMPVSSPPEAIARINYVCITLLSYPTPTPTMPPTPTSAPPPTSCSNPSYDFSTPDVWDTTDTEQPMIVKMVTGEYALLLFRNAEAWENITLPQGQYIITVRAARGISDGEMAGFEVVWGNQSLGQWVINGNVPINDVYEYVGSKYLFGGSKTLLIHPVLPDVFGGRIHSICLSYMGDPNPQPTPTATVPGPTPTPTPPPDPPYCVNPDPGINTTSVWALIGTGSIANSEATLNAGDQLAADIQPEQDHDYDVVIAGRCTQPSTANVYWRGQMQTMLCVGANMPFNLTFYFPAESVSFISSPLVDLLLPPAENGELIIPADLPRGFAPQLFNSPLAEPSPPPLAPDPFMSPLQGEPAFPESNDLDAMMLMLSSILQIQASSNNTGQVIISSVCVQDRGWTPPVTEPDIDLYHPLCERDWAVQAAYTADHPALLVGIGAQAGMPVHAAYGGTVLGYGADVSYQFGGVSYNGCVVIDHSAALGVAIQSITCNLSSFTIPGSMIVGRGEQLGYTSDRTDYAGYVRTGVGLALFAMRRDGNYIDPANYFSGYPDCRPYYVIIPDMDRCSADDGSGIIPSRYNPPPPSLWEPNGWVPWLAQKLYDTVGYPILCALIPLFNALFNLLEDIANLVIAALGAPLMFIYRIARIFQYSLDMFGRIMAAFVSLFDDMARMGLCFRSIVTYFISAMTASREGQTTPITLTPGPLMYAVNLAMLLIGSTIANAILVPIVGLFIAYASWQMIPWGIRKIREAVGLGQ